MPAPTVLVCLFPYIIAHHTNLPQSSASGGAGKQDDYKVPNKPLMVSLSNHRLIRGILRQAQDERNGATGSDFAIVLGREPIL